VTDRVTRRVYLIAQPFEVAIGHSRGEEQSWRSVMGIANRGFASMDRSKHREIARKGGVAAHVRGTAHEWTREEARAAGRKGGVARRGHDTAVTGTDAGAASITKLEKRLALAPVRSRQRRRLRAEIGIQADAYRKSLDAEQATATHDKEVWRGSGKA
jgi:uncharacterized protein